MRSCTTVCCFVIAATAVARASVASALLATTWAVAFVAADVLAYAPARSAPRRSSCAPCCVAMTSRVALWVRRSAGSVEDIAEIHDSALAPSMYAPTATSLIIACCASRCACATAAASAATRWRPSAARRALSAVRHRLVAASAVACNGASACCALFMSLTSTWRLPTWAASAFAAGSSAGWGVGLVTGFVTGFATGFVTGLVTGWGLGYGVAALATAGEAIAVAITAAQIPSPPRSRIKLVEAAPPSSETSRSVSSSSSVWSRRPTVRRQDRDRARTPDLLVNGARGLSLGGETLVEPGERLGLPLAVVGVEPLDPQPAFDDDRVDLTVEVATAEQPLLHAVEPLLPTANPDIGRRAVLDEVQSAARPQHARHLAHGGDRVRNRAEAPRAQGGINRLVGERQPLSVQTDHVDIHRAGGDALRSEPHPHARRLDGVQASDRPRDERQVVPGPEADLDDLAGQTLANPRPDATRLHVVHHHVDQVRNHPLAVQRHAPLPNARAGRPAKHPGSGGYQLQPRAHPATSAS